MTDIAKSITGGCSCGAIRYIVTGTPSFSGLCYCDHCQSASGSACVPFMGFPTANFKLETSPLSDLRQYAGKSSKGSEKVINFCGTCGSLLFGGRYGHEDEHTVYAGSLDPEFRDEFKPTVAIFASKTPKWAKLEIELKEFETMPGVSGGASKAVESVVVEVAPEDR